MILRNISIVLAGFLFLSSCSKDNVSADCNGLRNSIIAGDVNNAMIALTGFIRNLPSDEHSEINLDRLVASLNSNCSVVAEKLCFGCIMTLPAQSEIRIQFFDNGSVVKKTFDLSNPPGGNSMIVLNMHD
jgi:hypothetical protein